MTTFHPDEQEELKNWINGLLHEGTIVIEFEKKDGSRRRMQCTLNHEYIAENYTAPEKKTDRVKAPAVGVLSVFDTEINEWRSIRVDSILALEFGL